MKNTINNEAIRVATLIKKEGKIDNHSKEVLVEKELSDFVSNYQEEVLEVYGNKSITLYQRNFRNIEEVKYQSVMQIMKDKVHGYLNTIREVKNSCA